MTQRTTLITGATQGMGRALALDLAARGGTVLLHGRDRTRLEAVAAEARAAGPATTVRTYLADLSDLDQVHAMADRVRAAEPYLDGLINNAVAGGGEEPLKRELSRQGHELRFAVNHLAPYALTRDLLPLLTASAPARVVNVASIGQEAVDFDDVMLERDYEGLRAYCRSKLAMIMATFELAAELRGTGVTVNTLHPAHLMDTDGVRAYGLTPLTTTDEGVRPTVRLLLDPDLATTTGRYFDQFTDVRAHDQAYDPEARARLMELTHRLVA
ncbi:SDR family NAD(P)-dependent oxidoreductase [Streptomyces sp. WAC05374]|uniref:SDR family NAD(P)-dependent oxidoreductase n=1 Tax=Streptomyces sp. WAC05374 TaxID=2487420 RepID=UPI000F866845|nr:SDR family NAD(P)-dependent oxidoreductase [Streptomyces sp. WAC05374]RST03243.1 SDR family NAD(P)-dependent oxidoreductase [Streptomyces sp. WAC05374]TDF50261.1 SDR family NAD(P)-dependent oxidoreductase [Streptomyces sp. WAC05374]TDF57985.1 SDR family NAD(P)-dependent oxidoreductase [Streptomyces sp. WAC05374]TDF60514.1 SDR family NAD(P)-dependent oxidoreductase [Streptomyces sp. WAC05374]